jgi:hypothetical protein
VELCLFNQISSRFD